MAVSRRRILTLIGGGTVLAAGAGTGVVATRRTRTAHLPWQEAGQSSFVFSSGRDAVLENAATAMGHVWLTTRANTREDQIAVGEDWLRLNLAATGLGLGVQPLSQALQEFPEMRALYDQVHARLAPEGGTVQMLGRIGFGPEVSPSPRWPLDTRIRNDGTFTEPKT